MVRNDVILNGSWMRRSSFYEHREQSASSFLSFCGGSWPREDDRFPFLDIAF